MTAHRAADQIASVRKGLSEDNRTGRVAKVQIPGQDTRVAAQYPLEGIPTRAGDLVVRSRPEITAAGCDGAATGVVHGNHYSGRIVCRGVKHKAAKRRSSLIVHHLRQVKGVSARQSGSRDTSIRKIDVDIL